MYCGCTGGTSGFLTRGQFEGWKGPCAQSYEGLWDPDRVGCLCPGTSSCKKLTTSGTCLYGSNGEYTHFKNSAT